MLQESLAKLGEVLLYEVFFYFFANQPVAHCVMDMKGVVFQNFLTTLMQMYKKEREVAFYASEQSITSRYFASIVKEKTGRSPKEWIVQIVINSIKQTLLYSGKSIKEIAIEYHFPSQSFFGKYFKQYTGMSPREFREDAKAKYLSTSRQDSK